MAKKAHLDAHYREALFSDLLADDTRQARQAAWALTHLPKADNCHLEAHRDRLVDQANATPDPSLRRLLLTLAARLEWDEPRLRTDLLDFSLARMADAGEAPGVRSVCLRLAWAQCRHYAELRDELRQCLLLVEPATLTPGLRHTYLKTMQML